MKTKIISSSDLEKILRIGGVSEDKIISMTKELIKMYVVDKVPALEFKDNSFIFTMNKEGCITNKQFIEVLKKKIL